MKRKLAAYLSGESAKGLLAVILAAGFFISLPFWLKSTPEQKQHLTESSTTMEMVEKNTGPLSIAPEEQQALHSMLLKPEVDDTPPTDFNQTVWELDMKQLIMNKVPDEREATSIAHWVYFYSIRFDVSPELILGLISVESDFDHFAVSNVGARGLMQVMPFWKKELGSPNDNLFDIETNIRYGTALIKHYMKRYKSTRRALAAYNGSLGKDKYPNKIFMHMRMFKASSLEEITG